MGMLPGVGKMKKQMDASGMDDKVITRQMAIIQSMTKQERKKPDLLAASRKKRIAAGAGVPVSEVNKLMKMHRQMADMMKKVGKMGKGKGGMRQLASMFGGMPGGMPGAGGGMPPGGMPQLPPGGMPGMGSGTPLPPGLAGFGKKK